MAGLDKKGLDWIGLNGTGWDWIGLTCKWFPKAAGNVKRDKSNFHVTRNSNSRTIQLKFVQEVCGEMNLRSVEYV